MCQKKIYRWIGRSIAFFLLLWMQGCVARFSGYIPSGPGTTKNLACFSSIENQLQIRIDKDVKFVVTAGQDKRDQTITLNIDLLAIPPGVAVQLLSPDFIFQSREWSSSHILSIQKINVLRLKLPPLAKLDSTNGPLAHFRFLFFTDQNVGKTGLPKVSSFTLQFPPLRVNDKVYRIDTIYFEAYEKWGFYMCGF